MNETLKNNVYWKAGKASLDVFLADASEEFGKVLVGLPKLKSPPFKCNGCGKCCDFTKHQPFLVIQDLVQWVRDGKWDILKFVSGGRNMSDNKRFMAVLPSKKNLDSKNPFAPTTCVFFDDETRKCTIYEDRPLSCRVYPTDCLMLNMPPTCDMSCLDTNEKPSTNPLRMKYASQLAFDKFMKDGNEFERETFWMRLINTITVLTHMRIMKESPVIAGTKPEKGVV